MYISFGFFFLMVRRSPSSTRTDTLFLYSTRFLSQDQNARNLLAGATVAAEDLPAAMPEGDVTLSSLPADLPSTALLRRPDIMAAEHQLLAANANIGAARRSEERRVGK